MWEKIKAFFENKITQIVCWVVLAIVIVGLIIGGATVEDIKAGAVLVGGIVAAVVAFILFIIEKIHKDN